MISYPKKIRNFTAFMNGFGYAGRVTSGQIPEVKIKTASHRGGGMDGAVAVDMGVEDMKAELALADWPPELIKYAGTRQDLTLNAAARTMRDFEFEGYSANIIGLVSVLNFAELKAGDDAPLKLTMEVDEFALSHEGAELFRLNPSQGIRIIGGVDQLAGQRRAMGI